MKPVLNVIQDELAYMRQKGFLCPFNRLGPIKGCSLCALLFPRKYFRQGSCPCYRLGNDYVEAVMREFFPITKLS